MFIHCSCDLGIKRQGHIGYDGPKIYCFVLIYQFYHQSNYSLFERLWLILNFTELIK